MNSEFKVLEKDERSYLVAEPFEKLGVINGFSRRLGGVSSGKISGLNFGFRVGDDSDSVLENYRLLAEDLGFDIRRGVIPLHCLTKNIVFQSRIVSFMLICGPLIEIIWFQKG